MQIDTIGTFAGIPGDNRHVALEFEACGRVYRPQKTFGRKRYPPGTQIGMT